MKVQFVFVFVSEIAMISFHFCFSLKVTQLESQSISCFTVSLFPTDVALVMLLTVAIVNLLFLLIVVIDHLILLLLTIVN